MKNYNAGLLYVIPAKAGISDKLYCMMSIFYVYIMASRKHGTLYTGVTNNLARRVYEHKNNADKEGFTSKYKIHSLVYFEQTKNIESAIIREKQIKKWKRQWKIELIEKLNPEWKDLYYELLNNNGFPLSRE